MIGSVSQRALHRRRVELVDRPLEGASLFPLFDARGRTRALMITSAADTRVAVVGWRADLFARPLPWRLRVRVRSTDLRDVEAAEAERLAELWHYDPWWVLAGERYVGHAAAPALRRTNIPGYDVAITETWFDPRLERVVRIGRGTGEALRVRRFDASALAEAREAREAAGAARPVQAERVGWRLRPFWERAAR